MLRLSFLLVSPALGIGPPTKEQFEQFKVKFEKTYATAEEELERFGVFANNLETVVKMNLLDESAEHSILTPFADLTPAEFAERNTLSVTKQALAEHEELSKPLEAELSVASQSLPTEFDWRKKGAVGPVKNQGSCGSCWAFATVANIEGSNFLQNGELGSYSEQELVSCDKNDQGCGGGLPSNAYKWLISSKSGLEAEKDYYYTGQAGTCKAVAAREQVFLASWVAIPTNEDQIAAALMKYGPLAIGIDATPMQFYFGGISDPWDVLCPKKMLDHGVALVGFGVGKFPPVVGKTKPYWTIKNSWGGLWGEFGYYRIVRGKGKCGMNRMVTSAVVAKKKTGEEGTVFV